MYRQWFGQRHGALEPWTFPGVVVAFPHFDTLDLAILVPGDPESLVAPFGRIADAIEPVPVVCQQEESFAS